MIYSPREKLQILRKQYKISQLELVGDKISRSHLAMIETGKTKLSKRVAQALVENFNFILENKGITEKITLDYLIEDTNVQIMKKRAHYVEALNKGILNEELIHEIENFIKVSDVESKVVLYTKIGDFYYAAGHLKRAFGYFSRTFDEALKLNDIKLLENLIFKLTSINIINKDYINNVSIERAVKDKLDKIKAVKKEQIINNFISSFAHLGEYDRAISYVDLLLKETDNKDAIYDLELNKAKFLEKKEIFVNAISIYRGMLLKYKDERKKLIVSINLMNAYKLKGELSKVESYYRKNVTNLKKFPDMNESQCLNFEMGQTSLYLDKNERALDFFKKVVEKVDPLEPCAENVLNDTLYSILKLVKKSDYNFVKKIENIYLNQNLEKNEFKIGYLFLNYFRDNEFYMDESKFLGRMCSII